MTLAKFANSFESNSAEMLLKVRIETLAGTELVSCRFCELPEKVAQLSRLDDYSIVEIKRADLESDDPMHNVWNKSLIVSVI